MSDSLTEWTEEDLKPHLYEGYEGTCLSCDRRLGDPIHIDETDEEALNHPTTQAFIKQLRGGIAEIGNSREELEEISSVLAKEPEYRRDPHSEGNNN